MKWEKMIIELMETASIMKMADLYKELDLIEKDEGPMRYLRKEIVMNELKKRNGMRHLSLEKAREACERRQYNV